MREICREKETAPGSNPGGTSEKSVDVAGTLPPSTEQSSVEIAKEKQESAPQAAPKVRRGRARKSVGEGDKGVGQRVPNVGDLVEVLPLAFAYDAGGPLSGQLAYVVGRVSYVHGGEFSVTGAGRGVFFLKVSDVGRLWRWPVAKGERVSQAPAECEEPAQTEKCEGCGKQTPDLTSGLCWACDQHRNQVADDVLAGRAGDVDLFAGSYTDLEGATVKVRPAPGADGEIVIVREKSALGASSMVTNMVYLTAGAAGWLCLKLCGICKRPAPGSVEAERAAKADRDLAILAGDEAPLPKVRTCTAIGCDTVLGDDVPYDKCAICRREPIAGADFDGDYFGNEEEANKCARKGCDRPSVEGDIWCSGHRRCAASASCDNLPAVPAESPGLRCVNGCAAWACAPHGLCAQCARVCLQQDVLAHPLEVAWQTLAEDETLDPRTIAACKRLRDMEVRS